MDDNERAGDPPCWAHLFEEGAIADTSVARLGQIAASPGASGLSWSDTSEDMNLNLLVFGTDQGVSEHTNHEVDVLIVGIAGEGVVIIDDSPHPIRTADVIVIPKGTRRSTQAASENFAYLTCHRRRGGLQPTVRPASN